MDRDSLVKAIVGECQSSEGFLIKLHVDNNFDSDKFGTLMSYLEDYRIAIQESDVIHREIAGCVFFVLQAIEEKVLQFRDANSFAKDKIMSAHAQIWNMTMLLFQ